MQRASGVNLMLSAATDRDSEKAAETGISKTFYANVRWLRRPGPWAGAEAVTSHRPNSNLGSWHPGPKGGFKGPGHNRRRGRQEQHPAGAVGCGIEKRSAVLRSAGCRPTRARGRHAGRGGRRFRATSSRRAASRASSCPPAQRPGRQATVKPAGAGPAESARARRLRRRQRRRVGEGAARRLLDG